MSLNSRRWTVEAIGAERYQRLCAATVFAHPAYLRRPRSSVGAPDYIAICGPRGEPLTALALHRGTDAVELTYAASFTYFELPQSFGLYDGLDLVDAILDWAGARAVSITLPPAPYGTWVDPFRLALRARGFTSLHLRASPMLRLADVARYEGFSSNQRRGMRRLERRGLALGRANPPEDALDFIAADYASRGRVMSEPAAKLAQYVQAGLPLDVWEVLDGARRIHAAVFYRVGPALLYMFAGRVPDERDSVFAWLLGQLGRRLEGGVLHWIDLGAAGYAVPSFDFASQSVVRYKAQLGPIWPYRETLQRPAASRPESPVEGR